MTPEELQQRIEHLENLVLPVMRPDRYQFTKDVYLPFHSIKGYIGAGHISSSSVLPPTWTYTKNSTGNYTITHNIGHTNYIVVCSPYEPAANAHYTVTVWNRAANSFTVQVGTSPSDAAVFFILIRI